MEVCLFRATVAVRETCTTVEVLNGNAPQLDHTAGSVPPHTDTFTVLLHTAASNMLFISIVSETEAVSN